MTAGKSNGLVPTSTVAQARVMIYQPTQRPRYKNGEWIATSFGRCNVSGRLGQRHCDLVESILFCAEKRRDLEDGGVELLVDPAQVRLKLSDSRYSMTQINKLLVELRAATVIIETPELAKTGDRILGGLIDHVIPSPMTRYDPLTKGERHLWKVRLGIGLVLLVQHDLHLYYDPAPIARLQHGISQAVARHILTHKVEPRGGWNVDTLIKAVAGDVAGKAKWNARARLKEDAESLAAMGIEIDGDKVRKKV